MPRVCHFTGKKTTFGNQITHRGKAKYLGGVGTKCTGISRRTFKPNLQRIHVWLPNGKTTHVTVATSVIRTGKLTLEVAGKMQTFPLIKDLVTDVSWNFQVSARIAPFTPRADAPRRACIEVGARPRCAPVASWACNPILTDIS